MNVTEEPTTEQPSANKLRTIKVTKSYIKTYGAKAFKLNARLTKGNGTLKYTSSNKNVVSVDRGGKVTIKGTGICTIVVTTSVTDTYKADSAKITITVKPKKNMVTINIGKNKTTSYKMRKLAKGKKYYIRIRTYQNVKINGKTKKLYSDCSAVKQSGEVKYGKSKYSYEYLRYLYTMC